MSENILIKHRYLDWDRHNSSVTLVEFGIAKPKKGSLLKLIPHISKKARVFKRELNFKATANPDGGSEWIFYTDSEVNFKVVNGQENISEFMNSLWTDHKLDLTLSNDILKLDFPESEEIMNAAQSMMENRLYILLSKKEDLNGFTSFNEMIEKMKS